MKRYTVDKYIRYDTDGPNAEAAMVETDDGEWVRQDEAAAEIERLRSTVMRLRSAIGWAINALGHVEDEDDDACACKDILGMALCLTA